MYVDNIIHLVHDLKEDIDALNLTYRLKEEIAGPPNKYLGSNVKKVHTENGKDYWPMHCVY